MGNDLELTVEPTFALVTGASRGIGRAIAVELVSKGINVTAMSSTSLDMTEPSAVDAWIRDFRDPIPYLLVCNAGINKPESIELQSDEAVRRIFECNFFAHSLLIRFFAPLMAKNGGGRIVIISSAYSGKARQGRSAYSSSKAAMDAFMRSAALEFAKDDVLVNSIAPGFVGTELTMANNPRDVLAEIVRRIPIGRLALPEEVAKAVSYLGSAQNTYITGQILNIDGGFSLT
jgi:3-oxoacyl-[acyl-carrier protein] reductase